MKTASCPAGQESILLLRNAEVHYRFYGILATGPFLSAKLVSPRFPVLFL